MRRMSAVAPVAVVATLATALSVTLGGAAASAHPGPATTPSTGGHASVTKAASHGGRVIVTLKDQFHNTAITEHGDARQNATRASQRGVVSAIHSHGGRDVLHLTSVNAVSARVSAAEVQRLRSDPDVASITRDMPLTRPAAAPLPAANISQRVCPKNPSDPLLEPEALSLTHFKSQPARASDASTIATGKGVKVGLTGINALAGNPNFIRPNGTHAVIDSPTPNADDSDFDGGGDEWYGDASSVGGQGTVTYDFSKELPYSNLPAGCTFRIVGIAPGASMVDTGYFGQGASADGTPTRESQAIVGLDNAAAKGASVVSESYGYGSIPGQTDYSDIEAANDELVASGITVVESAGDSGVGGTVEVPANDPLVIDAGATNSLRLEAQAWGYHSWVNNQMTPLSSGGTTPNNNLVDLVAPGYGGEASCSPKSATCPQDTLTEAFGGTSESAPFIAGAAADVIQAYAASHGGTKPTPALVKQLLVGTAQDINSSSDEQGSGLLDVGAAVRAAQQIRGSSVGNSSSALVPNATQVDVQGNGGSTASRSVRLYNASSSATTVTSNYRSFGAARQIGAVTTERVSAPSSSQPRPAEGVTAARNVSMNVPAGLARLGVDMITPNPKNDAVLALLLFDPQGRLAQISYDYSGTPTGPVSNNEHVEIAKPMAGKWTAKVVWNNGRAHLQDPPPTPGDYRGNISIRFTGEHATTTQAASPVTIAAHSSASVPLNIALPTTPGDYPESVQFGGSSGQALSLPISRRTLIPSAGGAFQTTLGSSVARGLGPLHTLQIRVPAGKKSLRVLLHTADTSPDNIIDYFLVAPDGVTGYYDRTPGDTQQGVGSNVPSGNAALVVANPDAGLWTIQAMIDLTTSGKEFDQAVSGTVSYNSTKAVAENVPDSTSTKIPQGSKVPISVSVTNTLGVGRIFALTSDFGDVTGPNTYIPAGATVLVPGTLTAGSGAGSTVTGNVYVISYGSDLSQNLAEDGFFFAPFMTYATLPVAYTVGPASG